MNKIIGCAIIVLYFSSYHISNLIYPSNDLKFWDLRVTLYCVLIVLAIKYNRYIKGIYGLIESVFISIVINNIIVNYFFDEKYYSYADLFVIPMIIVIEYAKYYKDSFREYISNMRRGRGVDSDNV